TAGGRAAIGAMGTPGALSTGGRAAIGAVGAPGALAAGSGAATEAGAAPGAAPARSRATTVAAGAPGAPTARGGAKTPCVRPRPGRPTRERQDQKTYEAHDDALHEDVLHDKPPCQRDLDDLPCAGGLRPGGSFRSGRVNAMRVALVALA